MKKPFIYLFLVFSTICFGQTNFSKGYYINNSGQKTDCFIKNVYTQYNPKEIEIKTSLDATSSLISISQVKEFSIENFSKYTRETVDIDISKGEPDYSQEKEPNFKSFTVFLKVLVEGKNSLYSYENNEFPIRFFFKSNTPEIHQLICKKYFESYENQNDLFLNDYYKRQLNSYVNCDNKNSKIESLKYDDDYLIDYFKQVNECQGDTSSKEITKREKTEINYKVVLNGNYSDLYLNLKNTNIAGEHDIGRKFSFGFGFEIELVLPFKNRSWSVYLEPTYNTYSKTIEITIPNPNLTNPNYLISAKYQYLQLPFGLRRNINLNQLSKLYFNLALNLRFAYNSKIEMERNAYVDLNGFTFNFLFGVGYEYKKISLELNQFSNINLNKYENSNAYTFKNTALSLKYRF